VAIEQQRCKENNAVNEYPILFSQAGTKSLYLVSWKYDDNTIYFYFKYLDLATKIFMKLYPEDIYMECLRQHLVNQYAALPRCMEISEEQNVFKLKNSYGGALFVDIVGFTEALAEGQIRQGDVNKIFESLSACIRGKGWIDKYLGDGMLIIFNGGGKRLIRTGKMIGGKLNL
jgi:hypothetical protein